MIEETKDLLQKFENKKNRLMAEIFLLNNQMLEKYKEFLEIQKIEEQMKSKIKDFNEYLMN